MAGISIWQLLILLVIVVMVFGTKRLRNLGGDLGSALKDFRSAMKDGESKKPKDPEALDKNQQRGEHDSHKDHSKEQQ